MELVKKSIRLPQELVDFVEEQNGRDFTGKLCGLLLEMKNGDSRRVKEIARYNNYIDTQAKRLNGYYELIHSTQAAAQRYEALLKQLQSDIDRLASVPRVSQ